MKLLVIESDIGRLDTMIRLIASHCNELGLSWACSIPDAVKQYYRNKPAILLLNTSVADKPGFDLFDYVNPSESLVIFISENSQLQRESARYQPFMSLLDPGEPELVGVLREAVAYENLRLLGSRHTDKNALHKGADHETMLVTMQYQKKVIPLDQVLCLKSNGNYSVIHFKDQKELLVSGHLKKYEAELVKKGFFRIHKIWLVNLRHISAYKPGRHHHIILSNQEKVPVAKARKQALLMLLAGMHA